MSPTNCLIFPASKAQTIPLLSRQGPATRGNQKSSTYNSVSTSTYKVFICSLLTDPCENATTAAGLEVVTAEPSEGETPVAVAGLEADIAVHTVNVGPAVGSEVDVPAAEFVTYSD